MNKKFKLITSAVLLATSTLAFAATDTTDIEINVTKDAFVNLTGTAVGSTNSFITDDLVAAVGLGTLGIQSNSLGQCDIDFTTVNGFSLIDPVSSLTLTSYSLDWQGDTIVTGNTSFTKSCNLADSALGMTAGALPGTIAAGTYSDTVTITVATQ